MNVEIITVLSTIVSATATVVIAFLTYKNIKLTNEIKELQIRLTTALIYSSKPHGAEFSENDFKVTYRMIRDFEPSRI